MTNTATETDVTATVDAYIASLHEQDTAARKTLVERAWAPEATLTDPLLYLHGHDELATFAPLLAEHYPGHSIRRTGDVDAHHSVFRFTWDMVNAEGETVMHGIDVGFLTDDGRIGGVAGFFDQ